MARNSANSQTRVRNSVAWLRGAVEGFLISLFNPKIALFFLAIFSHLVGENPTWIDIALMSLVTAIIDGLWYVFVTLIVTTEGVGSVVQARQSSIAMISGVILMVVALYLLGTTLRSF
jgi:threonine/homoserine/homoserine lactone efflux protein